MSLMYQCLKSKGCLWCGSALWTAASVFKAFPKLRIFSLPPDINAGRDVLVQFCTETETDLMNTISVPCRKREFQLWQVQQDPYWLCWQEIPLHHRVYYVLTRYINLLRTERSALRVALGHDLSHGLRSKWITILILEISVSKMSYPCPSLMK